MSTSFLFTKSPSKVWLSKSLDLLVSAYSGSELSSESRGPASSEKILFPNAWAIADFGGVEHVQNTWEKCLPLCVNAWKGFYKLSSN